MSSDGRTVVFSSSRQLLDADTGRTPEAFALYKWTDGKLRLVSVRPDGSVPVHGATLGTNLGGPGGDPLASGPIVAHAVSRNGHRVVFTSYRSDSTGTSQNGATIYVQDDDGPTREAVKETGVAPLPPGQPFDPIYRGASADVSRVFFTTASRLTPDSGATATGSTSPQISDGSGDLYVYDLGANEVRDLTPRLDGIDDPTVNPATADRGRPLGLVANSEDGKVVYFVANAQYHTAPNPEGELPSPAGRNLYMARLNGIDDPIELHFIATLGPGDGNDWVFNPALGKTAYASPDGSVLGFASSESLTGQDTGGTRQLFVYDAGAGTLACASCPADGSLPAGPVDEAELAEELTVEAWQHQTNMVRWVGADGSVFFETPTALLPADHNSAIDVYEYRGGALRLISSGTGNNPSLLDNASRDGDSVFFTTADALAPEDDEPGITKLYVARVGGGFPPPPGSGPACDLGAGACEGAPSAAPEAPGAGTQAFAGPSDPQPVFRRRCPKGKRNVRRGGKLRCVSRGHGKPNSKRTAKHDRRAGR